MLGEGEEPGLSAAISLEPEKSVVPQRRQQQREHNAQDDQQPDGDPRSTTCSVLLFSVTYQHRRFSAARNPVRAWSQPDGAPERWALESGPPTWCRNVVKEALTG